MDKEFCRRGQQEMVGFVLIIVLVVVGLMIFLVISLRNSDSEVDSLESTVLLNSVMGMTTDCAIVFEPDYDDIEELFMSCYDNKKCSNLNETACDYLNRSLTDVLSDVVKSERTINSYQLEFIARDETPINIFEGNCSGNKFATQKKLANRDASIILTFCRN